MIKAIVNNGKVEVNIKGEDRAEMLTELAWNIRKIDKLGRVSIPAELRRLLHINRETLLTVEYDSILKEIRIIPLKEEN